MGLSCVLFDEAIPNFTGTSIIGYIPVNGMEELWLLVEAGAFSGGGDLTVRFLTYGGNSIGSMDVGLPAALTLPSGGSGQLVLPDVPLPFIPPQLLVEFDSPGAAVTGTKLSILGR